MVDIKWAIYAWFHFDGRNRRPPLDSVNTLLSFVYTLLTNEIISALEAVGLDPCVGYLHSLRPGRRSLALDMLEELRPCYADRFVLSQINLGKFKKEDFEYKENGACVMRKESRGELLKAWQLKKQDSLSHPYLKEKIQWGMVPYTQAMLLARYIRGDIDAYPPFFWKRGDFMLVLVTYDICMEDAGGAKRLRRVAKQCQNFGTRVQNSVFECQVNATEYVELKHKVLSEIDNDKDSVRFYSLGNKFSGKVEHFGISRGIDVTAPLIL